MSQYENLDYYKNFYYAAKAGSISAAAKGLGISQPALSMSIQNLEKQVGYSLLVRKSRGISLTEEGRILYDELISVFEHLQLAKDRIRDVHTLSEGVLRIGADSLISQMASESAVECFRSQHPHVQIFVSKLYLPEILSDLKNGAIDCAILCTIQAPFTGYEKYQEQIQDEAFLRFPITTLTDDFIVGSKYEYLSGPFVDINRLAAIPYIFPTIEVQSASYYNAVLERTGTKRTADLPISGAMSRLSLTQYNHGFTYFPSVLLKDHYEQKLLFPVFTNIRMRQYDLQMLMRNENDISASVQEFTSILRKEYL